MWHETANGEFYWPLHPSRQEDHLRVWPVTGEVADDGVTRWHAALVLDGDYSMHILPRATAEEARDEIYAAARERLTELMAGLVI